MSAWGSSHCSKTNLWEASGRDPDVAAVNELTGSLSFRRVVQDAAAVAPDGDPAHKYVDFWLARRWQEAVVELLPMDVQKRIPEEGRMAAARYVKDGSSLLNPVIEAARTKEKRIVEDVVEAALGIDKFAMEQAEVFRREAKIEAEKLKEVAVIEAEKIKAKAVAEAKRSRAQAQEIVLRIKETAETEAELMRREATSEAERIIALAASRSTEIITKVKQSMEPPGVLETAVKIGFVKETDDTLRAEIDDRHYLLTNADNKHLLSLQVETDGEKSWKESSSPIRSAFHLLAKIWPKIGGFDQITKLISYFPDRVPGIIVGLGSISNPDIWKDLLKGNHPKNEPPKKEQEPNHPPS